MVWRRRRHVTRHRAHIFREAPISSVINCHTRAIQSDGARSTAAYFSSRPDRRKRNRGVAERAEKSKRFVGLPLLCLTLGCPLVMMPPPVVVIVISIMDRT
jgi:hypothetical protein